MVAYPRNGTNYVIRDHNSTQSMDGGKENTPPKAHVGYASQRGVEKSVEKQKQIVASVESSVSSEDVSTDDE